MRRAEFVQWVCMSDFSFSSTGVTGKQNVTSDSLSKLKWERWRKLEQVWEHLDLLWSSQTPSSNNKHLSNNKCELERCLRCGVCSFTLEYNKETRCTYSWTCCLEFISYVFSPVSPPVIDVQGNVSCWNSMPCLSQNSTAETSQIVLTVSPGSTPGRPVQEFWVWSFSKTSGYGFDTN